MTRYVVEEHPEPPISAHLVEVRGQWIVVEYEEDRFIQRKMIPKTVLNLTWRGPATISQDVLNAGIEYSDVDLVSTLGEVIGPIRVRQLQDSLRRAGLWRKEDYRTKPNVVANVYQRMVNLDVTDILNAAQRGARPTKVEGS